MFCSLTLVFLLLLFLVSLYKTKENLKSSDKMSIDATTRMFLLLMTISLWKDFQALQMAACVLDWCRFDLVSVSGTLVCNLSL